MALGDAIRFGWRTQPTLVGARRAALGLAGKPLDDVWLERATIGDYEFVPLRSAAEIATEAFAMSNCVTGYGFRLAGDGCRQWSMRKDGRRVATLQIGRQCGDPFLRITQLRGAKNASCTVGEWWAREWLNRHDMVQLRPAWCNANHELHRACWRDLWRLAKRRIPSWLPLAPSHAVLNALRDRTWQ
jgi:hypothetical protein